MPAKIPFYRTRKWIIIIAVVTLVVIAVAVGVGVGVSSSKKGSSATVQPAGSNTQPSATGSSSASGATVIGAPDSTNTASRSITPLPPFSTPGATPPGGDQGTTTAS